VWGAMTRVGLSLLLLFIATVAILVVMMWVWPCISLLIALSVVGTAAIVWRGERSSSVLDRPPGRVRTVIRVISDAAGGMERIALEEGEGLCSI
jgi:hypothetical protein